MKMKTYNPVRGSAAHTGSVATIGSEPSFDIIKAALHLARTGGDLVGARASAEVRGENERVQAFFKAAVEAGSTNLGNWAEPLQSEVQTLGSAFIHFQRPATILGKFGNGGRPGFTKIPFRTKIPRQTSGGRGYWTRTGHAKPLTKWDHDLVELDQTKVATISVFTEELLRGSSIDVLAYARTELANALTATLDETFIDPTIAPIAGERPGSILYGTTPVDSSGWDADAVREDVKAVLGRFIAANNAPTAGVWVMSQTIALALSLMVNPISSAREFPGVSMFGGTFMELPVITSQHVPEGIVALVNASDVLVADDASYSIDVSNEVSLEMSDNPQHNSITPVGANLVSMWQTNSVAVRAERFISWSKRRDTAAVYLQNVTWGGAVALT